FISDCQERRRKKCERTSVKCRLLRKPSGVVTAPLSGMVKANLRKLPKMDGSNGLVKGEDGAVRCAWHGNLPDYQRYHDEEWGQPVVDDVRLFEKLCLEGFQSGLSWLTILRKRENFRAAFDGFDFRKLAVADEAAAIEQHLQNPGIVRHRGKIASVYNNARRAVELAEEQGSLARFFWSFEPGPHQRPTVIDRATLIAMPKTEVSAR